MRIDVRGYSWLHPWQVGGQLCLKEMLSSHTQNQEDQMSKTNNIYNSLRFWGSIISGFKSWILAVPLHILACPSLFPSPSSLFILAQGTKHRTSQSSVVSLPLNFNSVLFWGLAFDLTSFVKGDNIYLLKFVIKFKRDFLYKEHDRGHIGSP